MINKTTSFKKGKKGKPKGNFKKGGKTVAVPEKKTKAGPKPDTECFYCKGTGHWKRNCPKYLADKKAGKVNKGICDIHVIRRVAKRWVMTMTLRQPRQINLLNGGSRVCVVCRVGRVVSVLVRFPAN